MTTVVHSVVSSGRERGSSAAPAAPHPRRSLLPEPADRAAIDELKRAHRMADVVGSSGIALHPVGRTLVGLCPLHGDRQTPNLHVYPENDSYFCFRCGVGGDVIDFIMRRDTVSFLEACERLGGRPLRPSRPPASGPECADLAEGRMPGSSIRSPVATSAQVAHGPAQLLGGDGPSPYAQPADAGSRNGRPASRPPAPTHVGGPNAGRAERRWDRLPLDEQVIMNTTGAIYRDRLWREPRALTYLRGRGLPDWTIRECGLGLADGHSLEAFLRQRGGLRVAQELGLLRRPTRGDGARPLREFLAGRLVVPEIRAGQCIWFIGRLLDEAGHSLLSQREGSAHIDRAPAGLPHAAGAAEPSRRQRPKFLALGGERPILGWDRVAGQREAFLCEGVFDYLTAVSWHLPACSPCGTHVPAERLEFLARAETVYGVFDGDDAGQEAAERLAEYLGVRWRPIALPDGQDLNDLGCRRDGRAVFFRLLADARRGGARRRFTSAWPTNTYPPRQAGPGQPPIAHPPIEESTPGDLAHESSRAGLGRPAADGPTTTVAAAGAAPLDTRAVQREDRVDARLA